MTDNLARNRYEQFEHCCSLAKTPYIFLQQSDNDHEQSLRHHKKTQAISQKTQGIASNLSKQAHPSVSLTHAAVGSPMLAPAVIPAGTIERSGRLRCIALPLQ